MTNEQKRILDEAHETLARQPEPYAPEPLRYRTTYKPEPEPEPERYVPRFDTSALTADWVRYIDQRIEERVVAERTFMLAAVGEALGEALGDAREEHHKALGDAREAHQKELRALRAEFGRVQEAFSQLRSVIETERRSHVVDLPALPRRGDLN